MPVRARHVLTPFLLASLAAACAEPRGSGPSSGPPAEPTSTDRGLAGLQGEPSSADPPAVSPPVALGEITWHPGDDNDARAAAVWTGTNFLVAWAGANTHEGLTAIRVTRMTPGGEVPSPAGTFEMDFSYTSRPAIAWNGEKALVVWTSRPFGSQPPTNAKLLAALVDGAGFPLSQQPIVLATTASSYLSPPSVTASGGDFLVAYADFRNGDQNDIYVTRVGSGGTVLSPNGYPVATGPADQDMPDCASDGTNLAVVWQEKVGASFDIRGARMTPAGALLDAPPAALSAGPADETTPRVDFSGTDHLVVWADARNGQQDVYATRWSPAAAVLDPAGIPVSTATGAQQDPDVAWDGQAFRAIWSDGRNGAADPDIYAAKISPAGAVLDAAGVAVSPAAGPDEAPAVACGDGQCAAAWAHPETFGFETLDKVLASRLGPDLVALEAPPRKMRLEASRHRLAGASHDGTNYLVVWTDDATSPPNIRAARVDPVGAVLDPVSIPVLVPAAAISDPVVGFDGENHLVVWADQRNESTSSWDIYAARVSPAGAVLDPGDSRSRTPMSPRPPRLSCATRASALSPGSASSRDRATRCASRASPPARSCPRRAAPSFTARRTG
jgi:hypothetical protein